MHLNCSFRTSEKPAKLAGAMCGTLARIVVLGRGKTGTNARKRGEEAMHIIALAMSMRSAFSSVASRGRQRRRDQDIV